MGRPSPPFGEEGVVDAEDRRRLLAELDTLINGDSEYVFKLLFELLFGN
jgi:hypothetical protein